MNLYQQSLRCNFCQKTFDKRNILKRHYREKHFCGNVYKCNMCTVSFVRKERLIRHLKSVHFNIKYHCEECGMKFVEKYKQNYHLVHSHGYAYCSNCKIAYRTMRPLDPRSSGKESEADSRTDMHESEHTCSNFIQFYKCSMSNCRGKKIYNRLNFFIRHLQLEHNITEFQRIKTIIEQNTFETRKQKKKSRIRAKTLEGLTDDIISDDLKELFDYAKCNYAKSELSENPPSPSEIIKKYERDDYSQISRDEDSSSPENLFESKTKEEYIKPKEEDKLGDFELESKGDSQLKELMQNINIMCMMENNIKKYMCSKNNEEDLVYKNLDSNEIVLGKRGRPSKNSISNSCALAETVVGTFLNKFEELEKHRPKKVAIKRSHCDFQEKETKEHKVKDKKKTKSVYFDDILMETLNITDRVLNKKQIFNVKRNCIFFPLNNRIEIRDGSSPFVSPSLISVVIPLVSEGNFNELKHSKQRFLNKPKRHNESELSESIQYKVETYVCEKCDREFYNYLGYIQHRSTIHPS